MECGASSVEPEEFVMCSVLCVCGVCCVWSVWSVVECVV